MFLLKKIKRLKTLNNRKIEKIENKMKDTYPTPVLVIIQQLTRTNFSLSLI